MENCKRTTSEKLDFKNIMSTESLTMLCRDDRRLVFKSLGRDDVQSNDSIYIVKMAKYQMDSSDNVEIYMVSGFFFILHIVSLMVEVIFS